MKFGDALRGDKKLVASLMRPNALFLSTAAQSGHPQLTSVYFWFHSLGTLIGRRAERHLGRASRRLLRDLIRAVDLGVGDISLPGEEARDGDVPPLPFAEESEGTRRLIAIAPALAEVLAHGGGEGATVLYPLSDFRVKEGDHLERGYLQGRFGAIPFLADLLPPE